MSCKSTIWLLCFHRWCLQDTFPISNTSLKQWVTHVLKLRSLDSQNEGSGSDDNSKPCLWPWTFPKAHGMAAHVWSTPLMYADMQNVSAKIIENMHLKVKDAAARSNGQGRWKLRVMIRNRYHTSTLCSDIQTYVIWTDLQHANVVYVTWIHLYVIQIRQSKHTYVVRWIQNLFWHLVDACGWTKQSSSTWPTQL